MKAFPHNPQLKCGKDVDFAVEKRIFLDSSWVFDKKFSTLSTPKNVENFMRSYGSFIKNRGIWKKSSLFGQVYD